MANVAYFARSCLNRFRKPLLICPNCGCERALVEARKYLVTELRRCLECSLLYRVPTDSEAHNRTFYNDGSYRSGFTTELPDPGQLDELKRSNFKDSPKDYSKYISILKSIG